MGTIAYRIKCFDWKVALLAVVAFANFSCSTPVVPDRDVENLSSSWDAYLSCVQMMATYGREKECDQISSANGRGLSYDQYYGVDYTYQNYPYSGDSYPMYLYSLDKETQDEMKDKWLSLSEEASVTPPWEETN